MNYLINARYHIIMYISSTTNLLQNADYCASICIPVDSLNPQLMFSFILQKCIKLDPLISRTLYIPGGTIESTARAHHDDHRHSRLSAEPHAVMYLTYCICTVCMFATLKWIT